MGSSRRLIAGHGGGESGLSGLTAVIFNRHNRLFVGVGWRPCGGGQELSERPLQGRRRSGRCERPALRSRGFELIEPARVIGQVVDR